jgi:subtilisin family serine protease
MKRSSLLVALALVAQTAIAVATPSAFAQGNAPAHPFGASKPIPGRYIVVFKPGVANAAAEGASMARAAGGQLHHSYSAAIKGFAATLPDAALAGIRNNPNVQSVEQDQTVSLQQVSSPQNQATWGLDRIDQADRPLDTQYHFAGTGAGVNAFIIDTGIRADHVEFTGRLKPGFNAVADANGTNDCNGHGTHVAGTVGGTTWGVAKGVSLIPVRVLDCAGNGAWSAVIAGIDYVANSTLRPAVANMSLGGGASTSVDAAVAGAVAKGVTVVVAAGNNSVDACSYSPAREPSAITVGATDSLDSRAFYSNIGRCVDVFAPGHLITSAWATSATASNTIGGTSMASPRWRWRPSRQPPPPTWRRSSRRRPRPTVW